MQILIADDSIVSRHLLNATLTKWGYEVVLASDGAEAWEILQRDPSPNIAILDWMMPGLTGPEVCQRVRERAREPYAYILLLTSKRLKKDLIQGLESGADDYLVKPFDYNELNARLRAGARLIELQTELLKTREALRVQATKDSLTGLWNRSSILDILDVELARSGRENRPLGIVLIDLDHFKTINDTRGHFAGDIALREAARRMSNSVRRYDAIGRYGGEEFLMLLSGCDERNTFAQAERLRIHLGAEPIELAGASSLRLTASFGCTCAVPSLGISGEALIRRADEALYVAKGLGRNRVAFLSSQHDLNNVSPILAVAGTIAEKPVRQSAESPETVKP